MIKQGYHHIDSYKPYQKFPGFSGEVGGKTCYFVFTVLPFWTKVSNVYICKS